MCFLIKDANNPLHCDYDLPIFKKHTVPNSCRPVFLVLGGSFNPIHTGHIKMFYEARTFLREHNIQVIGGVLALSSDEWIRQKLKVEGKNPIDLIPFTERLEMANIACACDTTQQFVFPLLR